MGTREQSPDNQSPDIIEVRLWMVANPRAA